MIKVSYYADLDNNNMNEGKVYFMTQMIVKIISSQWIQAMAIMYSSYTYTK